MALGRKVSTKDTSCNVTVETCSGTVLVYHHRKCCRVAKVEFTFRETISHCKFESFVRTNHITTCNAWNLFIKTFYFFLVVCAVHGRERFLWVQTNWFCHHRIWLLTAHAPSYWTQLQKGNAPPWCSPPFRGCVRKGIVTGPQYLTYCSRLVLRN